MGSMCRTETASAWTPKRLTPGYPFPRSLHYSQTPKASQAPWRTANDARQSPRAPGGALQLFLTSPLLLGRPYVPLPHASPQPRQICLSSGSSHDLQAVPPFLHATTLTLSPAAQTSSSAAVTGPTVKSASRVPLIPVTVAHRTLTSRRLGGWLPGKSCGPVPSPS